MAHATQNGCHSTASKDPQILRDIDSHRRRCRTAQFLPHGKAEDHVHLAAEIAANRRPGWTSSQLFSLTCEARRSVSVNSRKEKFTWKPVTPDSRRRTSSVTRSASVSTTRDLPGDVNSNDLSAG